MKKYLSDYVYLLSIAGTVVLLDQLTKHLVRANIPMGVVFMPDAWLSQFARIVHWKNTGAAFGMFQSLGGVFTVLSIIVSLVILYYFPQVSRQEWPVRLAMGMLLGGASGNLIDRLTIGHVTDFISIWFFPVFNLADLSITSGVIVLFLGMWYQEQQKQPEQAPLLEGKGKPPQQASSPSFPEEMQGD
ncbi:MAG: signal peptidase II [Anaerolineales bacterium]|nr:signal peptidase II [Anaerolineales bacterium]